MYKYRPGVGNLCDSGMQRDNHWYVSNIGKTAYENILR